MNGATQIKQKQKEWAKRTHQIMDSKYEYYITDLNNNIFMKLSKQTESEFKNADGNELLNMKSRPAKMNAIHSSSALAVNVFQYWRENNRDIKNIAVACGFCSNKNSRKFQMEFEKKFTIEAKSKHHPNIDVLISGSGEDEGKVFAIESKMTEPFSSNHSSLSNEYLSTDVLWTEFPNLKMLANDIHLFKYLDVAQLIKHILGLKNEFKSKDKFQLMYLYYDVAGKDGAAHFDEILKFKSITDSDSIDFRYLSYQELIARLCRDNSVGNEEYCDYISNRYL